MSVEETARLLNKKFNCEICENFDFTCIVEHVIIHANGVIKKNPVMKNISNNIFESIAKKVKVDMECGHLKQLIIFAAEKCMTKAARNLKRGIDFQVKKGKKPVAVRHYKLKIMK